MKLQGKMVAVFHAAVSSLCCLSLVSAGGGCFPGRPLLSSRAEQQEKVNRGTTDKKDWKFYSVEVGINLHDLNL